MLKESLDKAVDRDEPGDTRFDRCHFARFGAHSLDFDCVYFLLSADYGKHMDALQAICNEHNLILLEDACQSIGATYKGKYVGTIGDAGTFSFDFVKTITCGEGGAVLTNNEDVYTKCDGYTDHGHDHKGADRGADLHPFVGYNYRISELHAAIGVAQIGKLDNFLSIQRKNHSLLKGILSSIPEIRFRKIHDEEGDSCTFLSWFLPDAETTTAVVNELRSQNILAGNFYWFENNWHYIKKWNHLKTAATLYPLHEDQKQVLLDLGWHKSSTLWQEFFNQVVQVDLFKSLASDEI